MSGFIKRAQEVGAYVPRMPDFAEQYAALADPFTAVAEDLPAEAWGHPSACEGWTAADVLHHVVRTTTDFLGQHGVDLPECPTAAEVLADPPACWRAHDARVRATLSKPEVAEREYDGAFGRTTLGETITQFYGFDLIVHRWDIAVSARRDERLSDAEIDLLERSVEFFGEHLYMDGICRPAVAVPADADRQTRVLARLGRRRDSAGS